VSEVQEQSSALATIERTDLVAVFTRPNGVETILQRIEREAREQAAALDISSAGGRKSIASLAYKVARSKTALDGTGKDLKAEWLAKSNAVDAERRTLRERLDALAEEVRAPLTAWEDAEKTRIQAHETALAAIVEDANYGTTESADELADRLAYLRDYHTRDWQEFAKRAADTLVAEITRTETLHAAAVKREAEAAELARLRAEEVERQRLAAIEAQRIREERIAAEAAESARRAAEAKAARDAEEARQAAQRAQEAAARREQEARQAAERAEAARVAAEQKAERDRIAAAERAGRDRLAAIEAERQRVAAAAAAEKAEADRRAANTAHRTKINREALAALVQCGLTEELGKAVVAAVARGEVPHITIGY
jgi:hypothetical protein